MNQLSPENHDDLSSACEVLGQLHASAGRLEDAIMAFERGLNMNRENNTIFYWKAVALSDAGNFESALLVSEEAISRCPDLFQPYSTKIHCLRKLGRFEEAFGVGKSFLEFLPMAHAMWYEQGCTLFHQNNYEDAFFWLDRTVRRCNHAEAFELLARICASRGDITAIAHFQSQFEKFRQPTCSVVLDFAE
jgi:tetratricopeptide (TPR) repeat protein